MDMLIWVSKAVWEPNLDIQHTFLKLKYTNLFQEEPNDLVSFREKWQKELQNSSPFANIQSKLEDCTLEIEDNESRAKKFFIKGIEMEKAGKMYEAIQFYRRAVQLVPDIEFKVDSAPKTKPTEILTDFTVDGKFW